MTALSHDASSNDGSHFNKLDFDGNIHRFSEMLMQISEKPQRVIDQSIVTDTLQEILEMHSENLSTLMGLFTQVAAYSDRMRRKVAFNALTENEELLMHSSEVRKQYCELLKLFAHDRDISTQETVFFTLLRFPERDQAYLEDIARNGSLQTRTALVSAMSSKYKMVCNDFPFELDRQVLLVMTIADPEDLSFLDRIKSIFSHDQTDSNVRSLKRGHARVLVAIEDELKWDAINKNDRHEMETLVPLIDELISNKQYDQVKTYLLHENLVISGHAAQRLAEHGLLKGNPELLLELCASPCTVVMKVALDYWETPTDQPNLSKARAVLEHQLVENRYDEALKSKIVERLADRQILSYPDLVRLFSDRRFECLSMYGLSDTIIQSFEKELAAQAIPQSDLVQILFPNLPIESTQGFYMDTFYTALIEAAINKIALIAVKELEKQGAIDREVALRIIGESKFSSVRVFAVGLLSKFEGGQALLQSILENKESREKDIALAAYKQLKTLGVTDVALGERMLARGRGFGEDVSSQIISSLITDPVGNRKLLKRLAKKFPVCAKDVAQAFARARD